MSLAHPAILLVEDNEDDVFIMKLALRRSGVDYPLRIISDGQQALDYLSGSSPSTDREGHPFPFVVFLDLKLPYISGFEVLARIRQRPELNALPVVVLTSSSESKDSERAYALGAQSYLVKPPTAQNLRDIFHSLGNQPG